MTFAGRLKRSLFSAIVVVVAGTAGALSLGLLANQATAPGSRVGNLAADLLGMPLAPGYFLLRGTFEKLGSCSSLNQVLGPALLIILVSVVIDTGLICAAWEFFHWKSNRGSRSDSTLHING